MVTLSPPTSEAGVRFLAQPQVGKLVVACRWSAVYSTEVVYIECISSRVSHQSCHFLTAVQLPGADGRLMAR